MHSDHEITDHPLNQVASNNPISNNETTQFNHNEIRIFESFDEMNLKDELLRGIYDYGLNTPTEIQKQAIVPCMQGTCLKIIILKIDLLSVVFMVLIIL